VISIIEQVLNFLIRIGAKEFVLKLIEQFWNKHEISENRKVLIQTMKEAKTDDEAQKALGAIVADRKLNG